MQAYGLDLFDNGVALETRCTYVSHLQIAGALPG